MSVDQDRNELYIKMLDEDNSMLIEDNNLLRNKLTDIKNSVEKLFAENTKAMKECTGVRHDYFQGRRSILHEIKKLL